MLRFTTLLMLATFCGDANAQDAQAAYEIARAKYVDSIKSQSLQFLSEIYENSSLEFRKALPLGNITIEVLDARDRACSSPLLMGYLRIEEAIKFSIVVCEEDVATAADYGLARFIGLQHLTLKYSSFFTEEAIKSNTPAPTALTEETKNLLRSLADYYAEANKREKKVLSDLGRRGRARCFAWDALVRAMESTKKLQECSRQSLGDEEARANAGLAIADILSGVKLYQEVGKISAPFNSEFFAENQLDAMNRIRRTYFNRFLFYVVAHEFAHIHALVIDGDREWSLDAATREMNADRFVVSSINRFQARTFSLPFLAMNLRDLWQASGDIGMIDVRGRSLTTLVFCEERDRFIAPDSSASEKTIFDWLQADCKK